MFTYLRYFSAISFVLVIIVAVMVGVYFKSIASEDLSDLVKRNNMAFSQSYINAIWKKRGPMFSRLSTMQAKHWGVDPEFELFKRESKLFIEQTPIAKMNVYTPQGELIFSSDAGKILFTEDSLEEGEGKFGFDYARQGYTSSRILDDSGFHTSAGQPLPGTLVQTTYPIMPDTHSPVLATSDSGQPTSIEGIIEIFFDVTAQSNRLSTFQYVSTGAIIMIFAVLISVLVFTSRRAESIIAKQHEVNLELTAAASAAEAENRDKSQFLANISHELRTPLNAIIGFSEIIRSEATTVLNPTHQEYMNDIHSSGVHLLSLINDILDYSKAEAGKLELELAEVDATKLIKNSMRLVIPRAESAQVTLIEELPSQHFIMVTDGKKLKQVLLNLLSNAVKFTPAGGEVKVSAWENFADNSIAIEVKDTGIGIAPKDISRVMTPFGQVDSTLAKKYEGTGLGLPLSKKFVEIMGGVFSIESEVGKGTKITLKLPRENKAYSKSASPQNPAATSDALS